MKTTETQVPWADLGRSCRKGYTRVPGVPKSRVYSRHGLTQDPCISGARAYPGPGDPGTRNYHTMVLYIDLANGAEDLCKSKWVATGVARSLPWAGKHTNLTTSGPTTPPPPSPH
jgi:hypothetical protein